MNSLPAETLFKILSFIGMIDITNTKITCKLMNMICEDPMLRYWKIRLEFPYKINVKSDHLSWKQLYINIYSDTYSVIPIYQNNIRLGHIELHNTNCQSALTYLQKYLTTPSSITFKDKYDNMIHRYQYIPAQNYVHVYSCDRSNAIHTIEISKNYNVGLLEYLVRQPDTIRI